MKRNRTVLGVVILAAAGTLGFSACKAKEPAAGVESPASLEAPAPTPPALVTDTLAVDGQDVTITHSAFAIGRVHDMFDSDPMSLARTVNANPAVIELVFAKPRALRGIDVSTASMDVGLKVVATLAEGGEKTFAEEFRHIPTDPTVTLDFEGLTGRVAKMRIEVWNLGHGDGHIHIRSLKLR